MKSRYQLDTHIYTLQNDCPMTYDRRPKCVQQQINSVISKVNVIQLSSTKDKYKLTKKAKRKKERSSFIVTSKSCSYIQSESVTRQRILAKSAFAFYDLWVLGFELYKWNSNSISNIVSHPNLQS